MLAALFLQFNFMVANNYVFGEEEEITDEIIEIISKLDLLESLAMLEEDLSFLEVYQEVNESDESEITGGNDDQ